MNASKDAATGSSVDGTDFQAFLAFLNGTDQPYGAGGDPVTCWCFDADADGDVDMSDFGHLQVCLSGTIRQTDPDCADTLLDGDDYVNQTDVSLFIGCLSGAGLPAAPDCMGQ